MDLNISIGNKGERDSENKIKDTCDYWLNSESEEKNERLKTSCFQAQLPGSKMMPLTETGKTEIGVLGREVMNLILD